MPAEAPLYLWPTPLVGCWWPHTCPPSPSPLSATQPSSRARPRWGPAAAAPARPRSVWQCCGPSPLSATQSATQPSSTAQPGSSGGPLGEASFVGSRAMSASRATSLQMLRRDARHVRHALVAFLFLLTGIQKDEHRIDSQSNRTTSHVRKAETPQEKAETPERTIQQYSNIFSSNNLTNDVK